MIIDIDQKPDCIDISYLDKNGNKAIMQLPVANYSQWTVDHNGNGTPGYIDISGKLVVQKWAKSFRRFDLLAFLKSQPQSVQDELFAYREANLITADIETAIGDRFPKPELADMPINAISNVDQSMNVLVYTTKPVSGEVTVYDIELAKQIDGEWEPGAYEEQEFLTYAEIARKNYKGIGLSIATDAYAAGKTPTDSAWVGTGNMLVKRPRITDIHDEVNRIILEQVGHLMEPHERENFDCKLLHFDTEKQLLEAWLGNVCKFAAVLSFWNGDGFDKPYIFNRCKKLGINSAIGSITGQIASMTNTPKHTVFSDYMFLVDEYDRRIKNKESLKLDYISMRLLGKGKLPYRGTLKELSEHDIPGFLAYNAIDSILVQLIHRQLNLMASLYGFCSVCKLELAKANSQVAQTESLISLDTLEMLDTTGVDMPEKPDIGAIQVAAYDPIKPPRRKYDGGHCKEPHKHAAKWCACIDYSGLYPSCHRSCNLSVENYIGPISNFSPLQQHQIMHDTKNYFVSVNNKVYRNDRPYAYKRIQVFLRAKRDYHKKIMNKHLSLYQPFIEHALHERGVWKEDANYDKSIKTLPWTVYIEDKAYTPDLAHLNEPGDQEGYEHATDFLWFLFHENLRQGFFAMNQQVSYKLVANSLYGATANEFNSFGNVDVADDTTAEGRNSILTGEKVVNNWFNFEWQHDTAAHNWLREHYPNLLSPEFMQGVVKPLEIRDRVMYIDTDSLYIEFCDFLENIGIATDDYDNCISIFVGFYSKYLGPIIEQRLHNQLNMRGGQSMQAFDLEHISCDALFRKKKSYMKANSWDDGRTYSYEDAFAHLKCTGFALARSFQPLRCREAARKAIVEIMQGEWKTKDDYLRNMMTLWQDFQTWSIEDISKRMSIRKDQYESHILGMEPYPVFASRTLPQYKAAAWFNWQLIQRGLADTIQPIEDGFLCFYADAYGNHFGYRIYELPDWRPDPDKVTQFYKLVGDVIRDVAVYYGIVCPLPIGDSNYTGVSDAYEDN